MNKIEKFLIFLYVFIKFTIYNCITIFLLFLVSYKVQDLHNRDCEKKIEKYLSSYKHSSIIAYYNSNCIYYNYEIAVLDNNLQVCWIDDNCIIYYSFETKKYFLINSDFEVKCLNENYKLDFYSINYYNSKIYYSREKMYYEFNVNEEKESIISKEYYHRMIDGVFYCLNFDDSTIGIKSDNGYERSINVGDLSTIRNMCNIPYLNRFDISNYQIRDKYLYFSLVFERCLIVIKYDIVEDTYSLFDWQKNESNNVSYMKFCIFEDYYSSPLSRFYIN